MFGNCDTMSDLPWRAVLTNSSAKQAGWCVPDSPIPPIRLIDPGLPLIRKKGTGVILSTTSGLGVEMMGRGRCYGRKYLR